MSHNLGQTSLRRRCRSGDPMQAYDALPAPLRRWLAEAALPWSPASVRKVWRKALNSGLATSEALELLTRCEVGTLRRDRHAKGCDQSDLRPD